jgi:hypothetical protein
VPAADLGHAVEVDEIHDLGHVCDREPERVGVPVDRDDAVAELADVLDRAALVAARADEEQRLQRVPSAFAQIAGEPPRR